MNNLATTTKPKFHKVVNGRAFKQLPVNPKPNKTQARKLNSNRQIPKEKFSNQK